MAKKQQRSTTDPIVRRAAAQAADAASARSRAARLSLVRIALLVGVLAFGGAVWWLRRSGQVPVSTQSPEALRTFGGALWLAGLAGVVLFWYLLPRTRDERRRSSYLIFSWAAAEMPALFGAAYYYLTGDVRWYAAGLTLLVASLLLMPARRQSSS